MKITKQLHKQLWAYSLRILLMVMTLIVFPKDSLRAQCPDPVNFLYLLDNSGSISAADWNGMRNMINSSVTAVKAEFPNALFAIVHMAYSGGTSGVQSNFTNTPPLVAGKLDSGNSPNISFNGLASEISDNDGYLEGNTSAPMVVVYFTDGSASEHTNGAYAGRNAFMTAALARYPQVEIIVVQVGSSAQAAAAATASVGGMYYGTPLANGGDPEGSRTTPRNMIYRSSFTGNVDAELLATYSCTPCTGSENQSATFDFDPRTCATGTGLYFFPINASTEGSGFANVCGFGASGWDGLGNMGGLTGANCMCQTQASAAGLPGTYIAVLSSSSFDFWSAYPAEYYDRDLKNYNGDIYTAGAHTLTGIRTINWAAGFDAVYRYSADGTYISSFYSTATWDPWLASYPYSSDTNTNCDNWTQTGSGFMAGSAVNNFFDSSESTNTPPYLGDFGTTITARCYLHPLDGILCIQTP